jgi:hypothetical protein
MGHPMWVAALTLVLFSPPQSDSISDSPARPSRHDAIRNIGWDVWASGGVRLGYDRNSFFIDDLHSFYRLTSSAELAASLSLPAGSRLQITGDVRATRDLGDRPWNRLDWLNVIQHGVTVAAVADLRAIHALGRVRVVRAAEASLFARWSRVAFFSDVSRPEVSRPDHDFTAGGALRSNVAWSPRPGSRWGEWSLDVGSAARYQRIDPFLPDFEDYRLLEGHGAITGDLVWPADPALGLGPTAWIDLTHDFGHHFWNRFDWKNNVTIGVGVAAVYQPISSDVGAMPWWRLVRVAGRAGYLHRRYPNGLETIPEFRPDDDLIVEIESGIVVGPRRP